MAKYKVNLDTVWNLPVGTGLWERQEKNEYCSLGLIAAGVVGVGNVGDFGNKCMGLKLDLEALGFGGNWASNNNDTPILRNPKDAEMIREKNVRLILQKGIEAGLFEIADGDLAITRELKEYANSQPQKAL